MAVAQTDQIHTASIHTVQSPVWILIPGLGADERLFVNQKKLHGNINYINFIMPEKHDTIFNYARRLAKEFDSSPTDQYIVCGVSFGGILAPYVAQYIRASKCVIISSLRHPEQCPHYLRFLCSTLRGNLLVIWFFVVFGIFIGSIFYPILRVTNKKYASVVQQFLSSPVTRLVLFIRMFMEWVCATDTVPFDENIPVYQIHGNCDCILPINKAVLTNSILICNGGHLLPLTNARELNTILYEIAINERT